MGTETTPVPSTDVHSTGVQEEAVAMTPTQGYSLWGPETERALARRSVPPCQYPPKGKKLLTLSAQGWQGEGPEEVMAS